MQGVWQIAKRRRHKLGHTLQRERVVERVRAMVELTIAELLYLYGGVTMRWSSQRFFRKNRKKNS